MILPAPGVFVAVVGPSGVGKDTLINGARAILADDPRILFVRRVVTRPAGGNEDHDTIDLAGFETQAASGAYALRWQAHGLSYGIPAETLAAVMAGQVVVANLSRRAVPDARRIYPRVVVVLVTAPRDVLADRLRARGRESDSEIEARLDRLSAEAIDPEAIPIDNGGRPEAAIGVLSGLLAGLADDQ